MVYDFSQLPKLVLHLILHFLDSFDAISFLMTCKKFQRISPANPSFPFLNSIIIQRISKHLGIKDVLNLTEVSKTLNFKFKSNLGKKKQKKKKKN